METKHLLRLFAFIFFLALSEIPAQATHLFGGEMTYEYLGQSGVPATPFRYRITLKHYLTDVGNGITPTVSFNYYNSNGTNGGTFIKSQMQTSTLSPILPLPYPSNCPISVPPMRLRTFVQTVDLPLSANGYYATAVANARNTDITNIQGGNLSFYIQIPPPLLANPGSSPVFTDTAVVVVFAGDTTSIVNSAFDADGDKLIYTFNEPYNFNAAPASFSTPPAASSYIAGYSFAQPFGVGGFASLNPTTGLAKYFIPAIAGSTLDRKFVVSLQVKEYRNINGNDVLIGSTMRDIQLVVKEPAATANAQPAISFSGSRTITVMEGQAITPITFAITDPNAGQLLSINAVSPLLDGPGNRNATITTNRPNPAQLTNLPSGTIVTFNFTSACGDINNFPLNITVSDNGCVPGQRIESFLIKVIPGSRLAAPTSVQLPVAAINENVAANTSIGKIQVTDPDACDTHTLSLIPGTGSTDNASFAISPTGFISLTSSPDFETKASYNLRIKAIDENGSPIEQALTLNITNVNEAPSTPTDADPAPNTVAENAATGISTGITTSALDQEGATITYSLTNNAGGRFAINPASGVVTIANGTLLDYETATSHQITVQASDGTLFTTQNFTIAISDIDEVAPTALIASTAVSPTTLNPIPVTVTFTENVTGFAASDLVVTGGSILNFTGSGTAYSFQIIPAASGVISVNIPAGVTADAAGNPNLAAPAFQLTYNGLTGTHDELENLKAGLEIYPNPAGNNFTVSLKCTSAAELFVSDLAGKTVLAKTLSQTDGKVKETLQIKAAPGIYLLQIKTGGKLLTKKLMLQ